MKKEVHPGVAIVGILLLLVGVPVVYWYQLRPQPARRLDIKTKEEAEAAGPVPQEGSAGLVDVMTVAGQPGRPGYADGGAAQFDGPAGLAVGPDGTVYIADSRNHAIRALSPDGTVTTIAGQAAEEGSGGYADGVGRAAQFCAPAAVGILPDGSLVVADTGSHRIRKVTGEGVVTTLAGCATPRDAFGRAVGGDRDGPAAQAQFRFPVGIAADTSGVIYVADAGNGKVRRVANGMVTTVTVARGSAGLGAPTAVAVDAAGVLWVGDSAGGKHAVWTGPTAGPLSPWRGQGNHTFASISGLVPAVAAAGLPGGGRGGTAPSGVLVLDAGAHCLYLAGGTGSTGDPKGRGTTAVVAGGAGVAGRADGPGEQAQFRTPAGVAVGPDGDTPLYVADFGNNCIRAVYLAPGWTGGLP